MISRTTSFGVGLLLVTVASYAVLGGEDGSLCVGGHPVKRSPDCESADVPGCISYGGLSKRPGYERDHIVPLCLGGPDTADNVQYMPWPRARQKDEIERHVCKSYCNGRWTDGGLEGARAFFRDREW